MYREQVIASLFSDVADATQQFRVEQEEHVQRFELRIQKLISSKQRAFEERLGESFQGLKLHAHRSESVQFTLPTEWDHRLLLRQFEHVHTEASQEVEMTRLSSQPDSSQELGEPASRNTRRTMSAGPTSEAIARIYRVRSKTGNFFNGRMDRSRFPCGRSQTSCVARFVRSRWFASAASSLIILNAIFIGIYSNWTTVNTIEAYYAHHGDDKLRIGVGTPRWASRAELFFMSGFASELFLRMHVEGIAFFCDHDLGWNMLDVLLVTAGITELMASSVGVDAESLNSIRMLRLLRLLRTFRSVRILRYLSFFRKFRLLTLAIQNSFVPFFWASFMLFWMLYLVSVVFLHGVADYVESGQADPTHVFELQKSFGRLDCSLLTLFMCITGGMDWNIALQALLHLKSVYGIAFVLFVAAMTLAALNIIAGIFVNDAIEMAQTDRDIVLQTETEKNRVMVKELSLLFTEFDIDRSGRITLDDLTEAFNDPEVNARFRMLGVEETDATALFRVLDVDGDGQLDVKEFVTGCLRAKSLTRPVDLQTFIRESRRNDRSHKEHFKQVASKLDMLRMEVEDIQEHGVPPRQEWKREDFRERSVDATRLGGPPV